VDSEVGAVDSAAPLADAAGGVAAGASTGIASEDGLQRFSRAMPARMAEKLSATGRSISGERKVVTVLFCDLAGSTAVAERLDPEEYREILDQYLEIAFREIYRFEGIVNQLAGDGLMALFGAPIGHEDDPQRALWAAIAVRDAMHEFNRRLAVERHIQLPARIGINTGPVVAGAVGNDLKMDYTAIGDTTNLASRLESLAAPGSVLISEETERLSRGFFRTRAAGPFAVKGKAAPVAAFEVIDAVDATNPMAVAARRGLTPLVGRGEELAQMMACFERLEGGLPQVVQVVGDAGSGKSRLIHELKEQLANRAVTVFEARCSALHQLEPYFPFISMLRTFFEIEANVSPEVAEKCVSRKIGVGLEKIREEFPHLSRLLSQSAVDASEVPLDELEQETTRAVGNLILREAEKAPVLVVFEDLHWADDQSRALLELALTALVSSRVMIVISSRPDEAFRWRTKAAMTRIALRPLGDRAMDEIMHSIVGGSLPDAVAERIRERAEGSPFFVEEITRSLIERDLLQCGPQGCVLVGDLDEVLIPGSVREVLAARLDSLDPEAKRVAQLGAVLGRQFRRDEVEELLDSSGAAITRAITQLVDRGVVHPVGGTAGEELRFGESLTQEVAYESLLLRERRMLHERVASILEENGARSTLVAHHYARSSNQVKAVETLIAAANDAERLAAFRSAIDLYRRAWEIADTRADGAGAEERRLLLLSVLGFARMVVLYGSSEDPLARQAAEQAIDLAEELGDRSSLASAKTFLGMILSTLPKEFDRGLRSVEEGVRGARAEGDEALAVSVSRALAWNYVLDGRFAQATQSLDWALERLREFGDVEKLSDVYLSARVMRQQVRFFSDDLAAAKLETVETIALARKAGNRIVEASSLGLAGYIEYLGGDYASADGWAREGLAKSEEIGVEWGMRRAAVLLVATHVELEGTAPSGRIMKLAEEGVARGGNMVLSALPMVEALVALSKFRRAENLARQALANSAGRLRLMYSRAALGEATLRLGEAHWEESEACFRESLRLAEEIDVFVGRAASLNGLGEVALVRGEPIRAAEYLARGLEISRTHGLGRYRARAEGLLAEAGDAAGTSVTPAAVPA